MAPIAAVNLAELLNFWIAAATKETSEEGGPLDGASSFCTFQKKFKSGKFGHIVFGEYIFLDEHTVCKPAHSMQEASGRC